MGIMKQQREVVILTDPNNVIEEEFSLNSLNQLVVTGSETVVGGHTEDQIIEDFLRKKGFSVLLHNYTADLGEVDDPIVFVGRNWPLESQDHSRYQEWKQNLIEKHQNSALRLPIYSNLAGQGDVLGKEHLVRLYENRAQLGILREHLIPTTFLEKGMAQDFPYCDRYMIKPVDGLSSLGSSVATRANFLALSENPSEEYSSSESKFIVQPLLTIKKEISFYFVDGELQYCLDFPPKIPEWQPPIEYKPSSAELQVAQGFIEWNGMASGITRLDFAKTNEGEFLLLEIEDFNPYLSLPDISETLQKKMLEAIGESLERFIGEQSF